MKKISFLFVALFAITLAVTTNSCNKDYQPSLSCKVDGTDYNSIVRVNTLGTSTDLDGKEVLLFTATDNALSISEGKYLTILIAGAEEKTYELNPSLFDAKAGCTVVWSPGGEASASGEETSGSKYTGFSGSVTITKIDREEKRVSGTFSFVLKDVTDLNNEVQITEGEFTDMAYQERDVNSAMLNAFLPSSK